MNYKFLIIFSFGLIFIAFCNLAGQDITPPERPFITYVTIDTLTGYTHIYWTESSSSDVKWYYLYYEVSTPSGSEGVKLDSLPPGNSSYIHQIYSGSKPLIYTISAIDSTGNESLRTPGFHQTIYLSLEYDSCRNAMNLSWNPYLGWEEDLSGYRIYSGITGAGQSQATGVEKNIHTFRFENIHPNLYYHFFIEAVKNDTLVSCSNIASKYTHMPGPPDNLNLLSVTVLTENTAEIRFEYTDTSGLNDFRLLRSINKNSDFISVASSFNLPEGENVFVDSIVTGVDRYYYKIGAVNTCNKIVSTSNLGTNILLKGQNQENVNILTWNFYEEWATGVEEYRIINLNDPENPLLITTNIPTENSFSHDLLEFFGSGYSGNIIYQVAAKQRDTETFSYSNKIVLDAPTFLSVPNAFTPNLDGKNDTFRPLFTLLPEKFLMVIYDRSGIIVFMTENPEDGWDGRVNGGEMATEGVYVYHIQYTSYTGSAKEKTGHLTLFYP